MVTFFILFLVRLRKRNLSSDHISDKLDNTLETNDTVKKHDKVTFTHRLKTDVRCKTLIIKLIWRNSLCSIYSRKTEQFCSIFAV